MPCRDDGYDRAAHNYESDNRKLKEQCNLIQQRLDLTTRILCATLTAISEDKPLLIELARNVDGLNDWWVKHQEEDRQRHRNRVESAKSKLTKEELEALMKELQG